MRKKSTGQTAKTAQEPSWGRRRREGRSREGGREGGMGWDGTGRCCQAWPSCTRDPHTPQRSPAQPPGSPERQEGAKIPRRPPAAAAVQRQGRGPGTPSPSQLAAGIRGHGDTTPGPEQSQALPAAPAAPGCRAAPPATPRRAQQRLCSARRPPAPSSPCSIPGGDGSGERGQRARGGDRDRGRKPLPPCRAAGRAHGDSPDID